MRVCAGLVIATVLLLPVVQTATAQIPNPPAPVAPAPTLLPPLPAGIPFGGEPGAPPASSMSPLLPPLPAFTPPPVEAGTPGCSTCGTGGCADGCGDAANPKGPKYPVYLSVSELFMWLQPARSSYPLAVGGVPGGPSTVLLEWPKRTRDVCRYPARRRNVARFPAHLRRHARRLHDRKSVRVLDRLGRAGYRSAGRSPTR